MKIAFIVDSTNSKSAGLGGHYYSMLETVKQMSKKYVVIIVNICDVPSKALKDNEFKTYYIIHKGISYNIYRQLKEIIRNEQVDLLHAFDPCAFFWVRLCGQFLNRQVCYTKCGGVNPVYSPYSEDLVLFSLENLKFFQSKRKFKHAKLYLIPNRIASFEDDVKRIEKIHQQIGEYRNAFKLLRIVRITRNYRNSTLQFIALIKRLNYDGINCCGLIIGKVADPELLNEFKAVASGNVFFFTDDEFTENAKKVINSADAVLGAGRSFMEAAAKGKILLSPVKGGTYPALITEENFNEAFFFNFSERIQFKNFNNESNYQSIKNLIQDNKDLNLRQGFSKYVFNEFFNSEKIVARYAEVYSHLNNRANKRYFDLFLHAISVIRQYYR